MPKDAPNPSAAELVVVIDAGQSIRDVAAAYLGDPDLWEEILRESGLVSVTELRPGTRLKVPWTEVSRANHSLIQSNQAISEAAASGARLFATSLIDEAVALRDGALRERRNRRWESCYRLANSALNKAQRALEKARAQRDVAAEAILSDRQGEVHKRAAKDLVWSAASLNAVLVEEEKVRTLSASNAELLFRDESRLRLGENSQAVIQRMRVDRLTKAEEASVSLVTGDVFALLGQNSARKRFDLEVPEVETEFESRDFWVSHDDKVSKFANYDSRQLRVSANDETVVLHRNQGTQVRRGERPDPSRPLLPAPRLASPDDRATVRSERVELGWEPVDGALAYALEVSTDPAFSRLVVNKTDLLTTRFPFTRLDHGDYFRRVAIVEAGVDAGADAESDAVQTGFSLTRVDNNRYFWRVAAVDALGFPGARSEVRAFLVHLDHDAPYLMLATPREEALVFQPELLVQGAVEAGATLSLNDGAVELSEDGSFSVKHLLQVGENRLRLRVQDRAGRVTELLRRVRYRPDAMAAITYDEGLARVDARTFVTRAAVLPLAGTATPHSTVSVRPRLAPPDEEAASPPLSTVAAEDGRFSLNLPLTGEGQAFVIEVRAPGGGRMEDGFSVVRDQRPPGMLFDPLPAASVSAGPLVLSGRADGAQRLVINGRDVALDADQRFSASFELDPGANAFEFSARDAAGNVARSGFEVVLDREAPDVTGVRLRRSSTAGAHRVDLMVKVRDASALRRTAPFQITVAGKPYRGYLDWNAGTGEYVGSVALGGAAAGSARLSYVEVEDELGNRSRHVP